ncbi:MAG: hypothetical protein WCF85_01740 [Rhodospirillaceae bacterium]
MGESEAEQPPRFVIQCAKGKGWKTLVVDESQPTAERTFREVVKVNPRGFFRLIRLDDKPGSEFAGQEFNWRLLQLHDPRTQNGGSAPTESKLVKSSPAKAPAKPAAKSGRKSERKSAPERARIPLRLYGFAVLCGAILAVGLYLIYGPPLR